MLPDAFRRLCRRSLGEAPPARSRPFHRGSTVPRRRSSSRPGGSRRRPRRGRRRPPGVRAIPPGGAGPHDVSGATAGLGERRQGDLQAANLRAPSGSTDPSSLIGAVPETGTRSPTRARGCGRSSTAARSDPAALHPQIAPASISIVNGPSFAAPLHVRRRPRPTRNHALGAARTPRPSRRRVQSSAIHDGRRPPSRHGVNCDAADASPPTSERAVPSPRRRGTRGGRRPCPRASRRARPDPPGRPRPGAGSPARSRRRAALARSPAHVRRAAGGPAPSWARRGTRRRRSRRA